MYIVIYVTGKRKVSVLLCGHVSFCGSVPSLQHPNLTRNSEDADSTRYYLSLVNIIYKDRVHSTEVSSQIYFHR
jgi:hypothetical protein